MESHSEGPTADLAAIAEARSAAADRLVTPWWYHPALGLLLGGYLVVLSFGDTVIQLAGLVVFLAGALGLVRLYTQLTGVWISGYEAGAASRWAYAMGGWVAGCVATSMLVARLTELTWPTWTLAAFVVVGVIALGRCFDVAVRAQLRTAP